MSPTQVIRPKPPTPEPEPPPVTPPGSTPPPEPPAVAWSPVIYDLRKDADAARFGLTPTERDYLLRRCISGRGGARIESIGLHVQDGYTKGSLDWWVHGKDSQGRPIAASSTILVQQDGSILRCIPERDGPWTQGDVKTPDARAQALLQRFGRDPNRWSLTIEAEDARTKKINAIQERAIVWQITAWQRAYPQLGGTDWANRLLGHYEINSVDKQQCGRYRDAIVTTLSAPITPPPLQPLPEQPRIGAPSGNVPTTLQIAFGRGAPWSQINRWDRDFVTAGEKHDVTPSMLKAMAVVESGGQMIWNLGGSGAYGIMQIKASIWGQRAAALGYDLNTPAGNIGMAAAMLGGDVPGVKGDTPMERFLQTYYPTAGLDVPGEDGHTPRQYLSDMNLLMAIIDDAAGEAPVKVVSEREVLNLISSDARGVYISFGWLGLNTDNGAPVNIYRYGKGHGTTADHMHTGIDIWMPDETPVNAVFGGEVVCVGGAGRVIWGQGCGSFVDDQRGTGNITILTDAFLSLKGKERRLKMTYGHMSSALVTVGQRIVDGERIGRSGSGGGWPHVHLDVVVEETSVGELNTPAIWNNPGSYHLVEPIGSIIAAMGGAVLPPAFATAVDIPQPEAMGDYATVTATRDGIPVLQYADPGAKPLRAPLTKGEQFQAAYQVYGTDGAIYWVTAFRSRIPVIGTTSDAWPTTAPAPKREKLAPTEPESDEGAI